MLLGSVVRHTDSAQGLPSGPIYGIPFLGELLLQITVQESFLTATPCEYSLFYAEWHTITCRGV